ncbi:MAG: bis(5'-nucleosyl)-tetraphosphatase (symmetrical) YqeK [Acholeplasmataceae bacterium]
MIEIIKDAVIKKLEHDSMRLNHTLGVYETAIKLAKHYKLDVEKVAIASLFHDYAKNDSIEDTKAILDPKIIEKYKAFPVMYHALSAAKQLEEKFYITDKDILDPIRSHIWGRVKMSMYEKVVFVADYAEPNRKFFDPYEIYELALKDIDLAVLKCMTLTLRYLEKQDIKPNLEQIEAYHYYMEVNSGKTKQDY